MNGNGDLRDNYSLNYKKFDIDMNAFVNENKITSPSNYLVITSTNNKFTYIYEQKNNEWDLLFKWSCTVGKPSTPTIKGVFSIGQKYPAIGDNNSSVKYAINFTEQYYYHSILYDARGLNIKDATLGEAISHGCIRLATSSAKWIYDNVPENTTVITR
ncbi:MAG: L,D-transpeptidase [Peptostreptococcaceae bacterium]